MYSCMNEQQATNIQDSKITLYRMSTVIRYDTDGVWVRL